MSTLNNGHVTGRLVSDPTVFQNRDGSNTVHVILCVNRTYQDTDGNRTSDQVPLETDCDRLQPETAFEKTPFTCRDTGDVAPLGFDVRSSLYSDKQTGEVHFAQVLNITEASLLESIATTTARLQKRLTDAQSPLQAAEQAAPAAV